MPMPETNNAFATNQANDATAAQNNTHDPDEAAYTCVDILIGNTPVATLTSFMLKQSTTLQDMFELVIPYMGLEKDDEGKGEDHWMKQARNLLGKPISAGYYYHTKPGNKRWFHGVVTNISFRRSARSFGEIVMTGGSPVQLMNNMPHTQSFTGMNLQSIVEKLLEQSGLNKQYCKVVPKYTTTLPYTCQYHESNYNYMARLAACYGEWLIYDGEELHFGRPDAKPAITLVVERNVWQMEARMATVHVTPVHYGYNSSDHAVLLPVSREIWGMETLGQVALDISREIYKTAAWQTSPIKATFSEDVSLTQNSLAEAKAAELFVVTATTSNPYLFPGCIVALEILTDPKTEKTEHFAQLIVTEMEQRVLPTGAYECMFTAVSAYTDSLPFPQFVMPAAEPQLAIVTDNADPDGQGRVKVQFPWQEEPTNFIRVMTPDAGSSDKVGKNRGHVFIPEKGDQVLIGFLHGHPDRPYVMGSMYHGKNGAGGGQHNHIKSITTRSGCTIELDDTDGQGSITVQDPSGNSWYMDGKGNIRVDAPKNFILNAGENVEVNVGKNMTFNVGNEALLNIMQKMLVQTPFMQQLVTGLFHTQAGSAFLHTPKGEMKVEAGDLNIAGADNLLLHSDAVMVLNSRQDLAIKSANGNKEDNSPAVYQLADPVIDVPCAVEFRPKNWQGEYGFDWFRTGDTNTPADHSFLLTVGKYYTTDQYTALYLGVNDWSKFFRADPQPDGTNNLQRLQQVYQPFTYSVEKNATGDPVLKKGYAAYLSLFPKGTQLGADTIATGQAKLKLQLDYKEQPLAITFDEKDFDNTTLQIDKLRIDKPGHNETVTITCLRDFAADKELCVYAIYEDKSDATVPKNKKAPVKEIRKNTPIGKLVFVAPGKRMTKDVVIIKVTIGRSTAIPDSKGAKIFHKISAQAYVQCNIINKRLDDLGNKIEILLNVGNIKTTNERGREVSLFEYKFKYNGTYHTDSQAGEALDDFLKTQLEAAYPGQYTHALKLFFLPVKCSESFTAKDENGNDIVGEKNTNGYSRLGADFAVFFSTHDANTLAHEAFHFFNLPHTFANSSPYTIKAQTTNNIVDYCHLAVDLATKEQHTPVEPQTSYYWQWKIINSNI